MLSIIALALAAAQTTSGAPTPSAPPPIISARPIGTLVIPPEIGPAIAPYMRCRLASAGVPLYTPGKKKLIASPSDAPKGADCVSARSRAATDADTLLKRAGGRTKAERAALIERTLVSVDNFSLTGPVVPGPVQQPR